MGLSIGGRRLRLTTEDAVGVPSDELQRGRRLAGRDGDREGACGHRQDDRCERRVEAQQDREAHAGADWVARGQCSVHAFELLAGQAAADESSARGEPAGGDGAGSGRCTGDDESVHDGIGGGWRGQGLEDPGLRRRRRHLAAPDEQAVAARSRRSAGHPAFILRRPQQAARLAREQLVDGAAHPGGHELGIAASIGRPLGAHEVLGDDERCQRFSASRCLMGAGRFSGALDIAAAPARLSQVGHGVPIERSSTRHLLQGSPSKREQPASEVEPGEARVRRALERARLVVRGSWQRLRGACQRRCCRCDRPWRWPQTPR
jgi:hypothetical protein